MDTDRTIDIIDIVELDYFERWENLSYLKSNDIDILEDNFFLGYSPNAIKIELEYIDRSNNEVTFYTVFLFNDGDNYYSIKIQEITPDDDLLFFIVRIDCSYYSLNESLIYLFDNIKYILRYGC